MTIEAIGLSLNYLSAEYEAPAEMRIPEKNVRKKTLYGKMNENGSSVNVRNYNVRVAAMTTPMTVPIIPLAMINALDSIMYTQVI